MAHRLINRLLLVGWCLVASACGTTVSTVELPTAVATTPVEVKVTFMSWAEDDFEVAALKSLIEDFQNRNPGVIVDPVIIQPTEAIP